FVVTAAVTIDPVALTVPVAPMAMTVLAVVDRADCCAADRADRRAFADREAGDDRAGDRAARRADAGATQDAAGALRQDRGRAQSERDDGSPDQLRHDVPP